MWRTKASSPFRAKRSQRALPQEERGTQREDERERAHELGLRFLAPRPRSCAEVRRRLTAAGYPVSTIDEVLAQLQRSALVDDQQFATYWVDQRHSFRPRGPRALWAELRGKGIDSETARAAIARAAAAQDADGYVAGLRQAHRLRGLDESSFLKAMRTYLLRRGFDPDAARAVAARLRDDRFESGASEPRHSASG